MGGMLTYNAINKMADIIAAFVSCSGPSVVTPNSKTRPVPILHIQGTADNFGSVQPALNPWIQHNGCSTTAKVISNYNGFSGAKLHIWGPGKDGVEVRLIELKDKGHWITKEPQVYTGKEIWNFCSRYSLNKTKPSVTITSPKAGLIYNSFAPQGTATFPDITITANADDPNGTVSKVQFYDGSTLLATCTSKPYKATLTGAKSGTHTLKVVATDNDGETASVTTSVTLTASQTLSLSQRFTENACTPAGWISYDGSEKRIGYVGGHGNGSRVMQLTGSPRAFNYGYYFRNINGNRHDGWIKYGLPESSATLSLAPGHYVLKFKACNWNMSSFGELEFAVEKAAGGQAVASTTYKPTVNIGSNAGNGFSGVTQQTFEFDVTEQGNYVLAVYSEASGWSDGMVGELILTANGYETTDVKTTSRAETPTALYDLQGHRLAQAPRKGIYIQNGKKIVK